MRGLFGYTHPVLPGIALHERAVVGGEFVVVRPLGAGGMGAVYVAEQRSTGKLRALKVMHRDLAPSADLLRRFEQEAKIGARIRSGHVVDVVAAGFDAEIGAPYLVMELLEGVDLRTHMNATGAMPRDEVGRIFAQLCHGVGAAHAAGIVHRDLKPENIFLAHPSQSGERASVVKILDFGVAKLASEAATQATAAVGSPLWMAPEQTAPGPVTPAADVWPLGLLAYELLTGEPFWRAAKLPGSTPMHLLREIVLAPIPAASERAGERAGERGRARLPPGFDAWFARCVAREPSDRFADASLAWQGMQPLLGEASRAHATPITQPVSSGEDALAATLSADHPTLRAASQSADTPIAVVGPVRGEDRAASVPAPAPGRPSVTWLRAAILGMGGLVVGVVLARRPAPVAAPVGPLVATVTPLLTTPPPPALPLLVPPAPPPAPSPVTTPLALAPPAPPSPLATPPSPPKGVTARPGAPPSEARPTLAGGFADPDDGARASTGGHAGQLWKVQDHHVRLLTRFVSNASNVNDRTLRGGLDWSAWEYLRCYEQAFGPSRETPDGVITVAFDVLEQLPRHAALEGSTFTSERMNRCVVGTLAGHTLNAAGAEGAGHVVYAFKFVVVD